MELGRPHVQRVLLTSLRQMQHVDGLQLAQQLVHFLLAVAGRFAHDQIGKVGVRALVRHGKAVAGLDEQAQVCGKVSLIF